MIVIHGSRSKLINDFLETKNSTFYKALIKSLIFTYIKLGQFEINNILISKNNSPFESIKFTQEFSNSLYAKEISRINTDTLFDKNLHISDVFMNSMMNLIHSAKYSATQFESSWKALNNIGRYLEPNKSIRDFDFLKNIRKLMECHPEIFSNSLSFASGIEEAYLNERWLIAWINDRYNTPKQIEDLYNIINEFDDSRVLSILKEKIICKRNSIPDFENFNKQIERKIENGVKNDIDIIRLLVLKYGYFLRNKYFHAERPPANFLIQTTNFEELNIISRPITFLTIDLFSFLNQ